jgi:hypothetical protein
MEEPNLLPELIRIADKTAESLRASLARFFPSLNEESGSFFHICSVLTEGAVENYRVLRGGLLSQDQTACALRCRNLLEISIFTQYVLLSKQNAQAFSEDRLIDGRQLAMSLKELELSLNPHLVESQFEGKISEFTEKIHREGVTRPSYTTTRTMARALQVEVEYNRINSLSSKLIHPTSWSLFTADQGNERFTEACPLFFSQGAMYLATTHSTLVRHLKAHGLGYPK